MSAYLVNNKTYEYIAGALSEAATVNTNRIHYVVSEFLGLSGKEGKGEVEKIVQRAIRNLYNLNRLALVTRYGEVWDQEDKFMPEIKGAGIFTLPQLMKFIGCVLYQCGEYLTDETETYKDWTNFKGQLAYTHFVDSSEFDAAKWDM